LTNKTITGGTVNATTLQQGGVAAVLSTDSRLNPVGIVSPFAGSSAPTGWLLCDGTAISRTTYSALFGVVGTTYGAGDASTTFNVPDLRGRTPIGAGTGAGLTARTLGATTGVESVTLTAAQSGLPAHTHTNSASTTTTGGSHGHTATGSTSITGGSHAHGHDISASGGGSHTHDVNGSTTAGNDHDHANGAGRTETAAEGIGESNASIGLATLSGAANTTGSAHSHTMSGGVSTSDSHSHGASTSVTVADSTSHSHTAATTVTIDNNAATGASASHENMQPSLVLNYIIKH
jgi:microcystin-dependent protein